MLQPQGREERPCQWSQEEAQTERKEAGWNTEASVPMSMCRPQGSSWMTQQPCGFQLQAACSLC